MSFIEASEKTISNQSAKTAFQLAQDVLKIGSNKIADTKKNRDASKKFLTTYLERYGQFKILGMAQPMHLESIYTDIKVVTPKLHRNVITPNNLNTRFKKSGRGFGSHREYQKIDGLKVANNNQFLSVLGEPGSGKSTFLKRIGLDALLLSKKQTYSHQCFPVFIELRSTRFQKTIDIFTMVKKEFKSCGFSDSFTKKALTKGHLLLLFDGLDEVPPKKVDRVIFEINNFVEQYIDNRFIISCRTAFYYSSWFERFNDVIITDFDNHQIESCISNWFSSQEDQEKGFAKEVWSILKQEDHAATLELARTPLLLTLLCLFIDASQKLPANRSDLYEESLKILIEKWAAEKRVRHETLYREISSKLEILLLQKIAGPSFARGQFYFKKSTLTKQIEDFFKNETNAPKSIDGDRLLEEIEIYQGLFVKRARNAYSFSHLTIQEFLAAKYYLDNNKANEVIEKHLFNKKWREIILLMAGLKNADQLLNRMSNQALHYLRDKSHIKRLLNWSSEVTLGSENSKEAAAQRATAIYFALALSLARDLKFPFSVNRDAVTFGQALPGMRRDLSEDIARLYALTKDINNNLQMSSPQLSFDFDLDKNETESLITALKNSCAFKKEIQDKISIDIKKFLEMPSKKAQQNKHYIFSRESRLMLLEKLDMPDNLPNWDTKEIEILENYLYAELLIVDTKSAAVSVSVHCWDTLVNRLIK